MTNVAYTLNEVEQTCQLCVRSVCIYIHRVRCNMCTLVQGEISTRRGGALSCTSVTCVTYSNASVTCVTYSNASVTCVTYEKIRVVDDAYDVLKITFVYFCY